LILRRIISGGQAGVDRGALLAADVLGLERGGTAPKGWRAEDGVIPEWFRAGMIECAVAGYPARTEANIRDADGTLIVVWNQRLSGGSKLTYELCHRIGKPYRVEHLGVASDQARRGLFYWLELNKIATLNIAGPRESKEPGIQALTSSFMHAMLHG